jgi:hypothetical protein
MSLVILCSTKLGEFGKVKGRVQHTSSFVASVTLIMNRGTAVFVVSNIS